MLKDDLSFCPSITRNMSKVYFMGLFRSFSMRVVIVCDPGHTDGGASKVAITSARGLAEAGTEVDYVCTFGPIAPELDHPRIHVHCLDLPSVWETANPVSAAAKGIWNGTAQRKFHSVLERLPRNGTVVHFHQWTKSFSPSVLAVPSRLGLPALVSLHDYFLVCPTGAYYRFSDRVPCTLTPMSASCLTARCDSRSLFHKAVRLARQVPTGKAIAEAGAGLSILSVSPFAEQVIDAFISREHPRFMVRSPIDVARNAPVQVAKNKEFVFVGRMTDEKGVRQLARVARRADLPVSFVGSGPLLEEIQAMGGPIRCTGWLEPDGVDAMLRRARALIFPSTWYETGGLVVLEALARGVPVLVSRATAPADFVTDGQNGFVFEAGDDRALTSHMQQLMDDVTAERMGRCAYDRYWASPQSLAVHVENLSSVYRQILVKNQGPQAVNAA
jgi:glycosyltransferase involved in cell wall biosynthesis